MCVSPSGLSANSTAQVALCVTPWPLRTRTVYLKPYCFPQYPHSSIIWGGGDWVIEVCSQVRWCNLWGKGNVEKTNKDLWPHCTLCALVSCNIKTTDRWSQRFKSCGCSNWTGTLAPIQFGLFWTLLFFPPPFAFMCGFHICLTNQSSPVWSLEETQIPWGLSQEEHLA